MKGLILTLCLITVFVGVCEAEEQPTNGSTQKYGLEYDLCIGLGMGKDCSTDDYWKSGVAGALGVNLLYQLDKRIVLRTGVSEQYYSSNRYVEHPFPYVMDLKTNLSMVATRVSIGTELIFPKNEFHTKAFIGAGVYGDIVHFAQAYVSNHYISQTISSNINVENSFSGITPGFMANIGAYGMKHRIDLRYTQDWEQFEIKGVPMGKQRRSFVGLNLGITPW